jgi:PTH1 family peptidyl-tRNA hydrolase
MKVVCGLGNPGAEYESTRHNVGWWVLEEVQATWRFPEFQRVGRSWQSAGRMAGQDVLLLEPLTFMNRSGSVVAGLVRAEGFEIARDLLVVVDDTALDVGRVRLRPNGSAGGHNGLKSIEASLRTREYARLRIGVGAPASGEDLADWVLAPFPADDERSIVELLPVLVDAVHLWIEQGAEAAANRYNR